jgi:hypothetical protein
MRTTVLALSLALALSVLLSSVVVAGEATGKVVFVDTKNKGLLIEIPKDGGLPGAKAGETFTFVVPPSIAAAAAALKAGDTIIIKFEEHEKDGPRTLTAITKQ